MAIILEVEIGDSVRLKKVHPCGAYEWQVVRVGADIGIRCQGCDRKVIMPRSDLAKRIKGSPWKSPPQV